MALIRVGLLTLCLLICNFDVEPQGPNHYKDKSLIAIINSFILARGARRARSIGSLEASNIPYQVSIQTPSGNHLCGGAILDATHILTSAYCVVDTKRNPFPDVLEIVVGATDLFNVTEDNIFQIVKKTIHQGYSPQAFFRDDIAILKLDRKIKFTRHQKPVKLPRHNTRAGMVGIASGWGATYWSKTHKKGDAYPRYLRYLNQTIISEGTCQKMMPSVTIYPIHLCAWADGKGATCKGDSGGPLVVRGHIVGINSWNEFCDPSYPDIYTRVYSYLDWIKEKMAD